MTDEQKPTTTELEQEGLDGEDLELSREDQQAAIAGSMGGPDQYPYVDRTQIPVHERNTTAINNPHTEAGQDELNPAFAAGAVDQSVEAGRESEVDAKVEVPTVEVTGDGSGETLPPAGDTEKVGEPVEKPVVEKPVEKPVEAKPADKPAEKPVEVKKP